MSEKISAPIATGHNLTELEIVGLESRVNLSDGHPRHSLTSTQEDIVRRLPDLFREAARTGHQDVEKAAGVSFLGMLGQNIGPVEEGRVFSIYSSSVATMTLSNVLAQRGDVVALIHPTFDNIPDLLRRRVRLMPVPEESFEAGEIGRLCDRGATCLFLTLPNNPTGWHLGREDLAAVAQECRRRRMLLCIDSSFRAFEPMSQFDSYAILDESRADYVVIEDSGKIWPVLELKLAFAAVSRSMQATMSRAFTEVQLASSPLLLRLVDELSRDGRSGGMQLLHALIARNRATIAEVADATDGLEHMHPESKISLSQIRFTSTDHAGRAYQRLKESGVFVLPSRQFFWARPEEGMRMLRFALARDAAVVHEGARNLALAGSIGL
jgi:aspartate/methionine/tyrosine aminotransferase